MKEEKKRILNMVEEGKLTVDEALLLLEELEKSNRTMEEKQKELVGELSTVVQSDGSSKYQKSENNKSHSVKNKFFEFVDSAFQKIKDFDLDFNFGSAVELSHVFQYGEVDIQSVNIDIANGKVKMIPWDQKDVRIECQAKIYREEKLEKAREIFLQNVDFTIEGGSLRFMTESKWIKLEATLFIPQTDYDRVKVRIFNGPIETENIRANDFNVKTANGKIQIEGIKGNKVEAETANGAISINRVVADKLEAETINGAIKIDGELKKVELQAFNGNIVCSLNGAECNVVDVDATTGSIELYFPEELVLQGILKTNLGSFKVDLEGMQVLEEKNEMVQKLLRFKPIVEVNKATSISAETKTGIISIRKVK